MSDRSRDDAGEDPSGFMFGGTPKRIESDSLGDDRSGRSDRESHADDRDPLLTENSRRDTAATIIVVVGFLLAAASIGYAVTASEGTPGDPTAFSLLTENENGELVASGYPTNFTRNESRPVVVAVTNGNEERTNYTVAVELQRIRPGSDGATRVIDERELRRFRMSAPANETQHVTYNATPTMTGENLRLVFFLYRGGAPTDPAAASAYRELHLAVNVTAPAASDRIRSAGSIL